MMRWVMAMALLLGAAVASARADLTIDGQKARSDRLIAKLKPSPAGGRTAALLKRASGIAKLRSFKRLPRLVVLEREAGAAGAAAGKADAALALKAEIKRLMATGMFEYVEPDYEVRALATPTDTSFVNGTLWGLRNTGQSGGVAGADIEAVAGWDVTTGSPSVVVAVIDTGIRTTHQDLAGNLWVNPGEIAANGIDDDGNGYIDDVHGINAITGSGNPTDDNNHGSHVAGTIGATANDAGPHVGVAWSVQLMALKFLSSSGSGSTSNAIECIDYALSKGATILSNSWGGGGFSQALFDAINAARTANVLFVAAAGNDAKNNDTNPSYPASYALDNVISVAAIDRTDKLASFSNFGATSVDVGAPGVSIFSCTAASNSSYSTFNGTSMATPHVSGVAALLRAAFPNLTLAELRARLLGSVRPVAALAGKTASGGCVSAARALGFADGNLEVTVTTSPAPLRSGGAASLFVRVMDAVPVAGAVVSGSLAGGPALVFHDDGVSPDAAAGDATYSASTVAPGAAGTATLSVQATAAGKNPFAGLLPIEVVAVPPNDDLANAIAIPAADTSALGTNQNASSESGEPQHAGETGGRSVWWTWTPAVSGQATISTSGSNFDTLLAVYTGGSIPALALIASNDDSGATLQSQVAFTAQAGVAYRIAVDGFLGAEGSIILNVPAASGGGVPSFSEQPAPATVTAGSTASFTVAILSASPVTLQWRKDGAPLVNGGRISGVTTPTLTITSATKTDEGVYDCVATNTAGPETSAGAYLAVDEVFVVPPNDDFADAPEIAGTLVVATGTNVNATREIGEPDHAGASGGHSVWWTWIPPESGEVTVDTLGSSYDTTLAVYTGGAVSGLALVASSDDTADNRQSAVAFFAQAGVPYRIAVDGFGTATGNVLLTARALSARSSRPVLEFRNPLTLTVQTIESRVVLAGVVSDDTGVARVEYRVNNGPWRKAAGIERWRIAITFPEDAERLVVRVRAIDVGGNVSKVRRRVFVRP